MEANPHTFILSIFFNRILDLTRYTVPVIQYTVYNTIMYIFSPLCRKAFSLGSIEQLE